MVPPVPDLLIIRENDFCTQQQTHLIDIDMADMCFPRNNRQQSYNYISSGKNRMSDMEKTSLVVSYCYWAVLRENEADQLVISCFPQSVKFQDTSHTGSLAMLCQPSLIPISNV